MSDTSQGPGWWMASDGKWYAPELHPDAVQIPTSFGSHPPVQPEDALASWAPTLAAPIEAPPVAAYPGQGAYAGPTGGPPTGGAGPDSAPRYPRGWQPIVPTPPSGGRFSRGLRLVGIGFTMARDEPGLMMVPVVAFVAQLVILGAAFLALFPTLHPAGSNGQSVHLSAGQWLVVIVAGILTMFVSVLSHATIISRVMARFHGQGVTNTQAARAALTKSPQLLAWAFINYVVVSILRSIGNRGILGLLVGALLRAGWMLASFFVVPVILFEDTGALSAIKRSAHLCRSRWGENIVGNGALGVIGFVAVVVDIVVAVLLGAVFAPLGVAVGVLGLVAILLVLTVASAAFNAALYWYAVTDQSPGQYSVGDLQAAYRAKSNRSRSLGF
jgi:hypothetical protein